MSGNPEDDALSQDEDALDAGYKAPKEKSVTDILQADADDESLKRYKAALLPSGSVIIDESNPHKVILKKLALVVEGRPDAEIDLSQDLDKIKQTTFVIKEGIQYRIRIDFLVQRDIVTGLKYVQKTTRKGFPVDKMTHMCGSYPPKMEVQSNLTPIGDAPSGLTGRGTYNVTSLFTDDDKHEFLKWEWTLEIKKDWE